MPGPEVVSMRKAARELSYRHGFTVTHNDVSFLVRIMELPTHKVPSNGKVRGLDRAGFRKLDRFVGRGRKVGA